MNKKVKNFFSAFLCIVFFISIVAVNTYFRVASNDKKKEKIRNEYYWGQVNSAIKSGLIDNSDIDKLKAEVQIVIDDKNVTLPDKSNKIRKIVTRYTKK